MFIRKYISRLKTFNRCLLSYRSYIKSSSRLLTTLNGICNKPKFHNLYDIPQYQCFVAQYSKKIIEDIYKEENNNENDITKINELFTQPRVTLNEYAAKVKDKVFDVHYKQTVVAPKGSKKKAVQNDWTCTYSFVWPEKAKFESTAISKRQAAEKSAQQALHWLYMIKKIDKKGCPIYDKAVIGELQSTLNKNIHITLGRASIERINRIWEEYESEISMKCV